MTDIETIKKKLAELEKYYNILLPFKKYSIEEMADIKNEWAAERGLQLCIQLIIDIGNQVLADAGIADIEDYTDVIKKLGDYKILPEDFSRRIMGMPGFRNILVHEYLTVDTFKVREMLIQRLDDFKTFAFHIKKYIEKN